VQINLEPDMDLGVAGKTFPQGELVPGKNDNKNS
jgi:hypothetical protein